MVSTGMSLSEVRRLKMYQVTEIIAYLDEFPPAHIQAGRIASALGVKTTSAPAQRIDEGATEVDSESGLALLMAEFPVFDLGLSGMSPQEKQEHVDKLFFGAVVQ